MFHFYPAKHITTLEAEWSRRTMMLLPIGCVCGAFGYDKALGERKIPGIYDVVALGHNFRMSEVRRQSVSAGPAA